MNQPAHGKAVASLVVSIVGIVCCFFGYSAILTIILGSVGIVLSKGAKKEGNTEGICKAGSIISIITVIAGIIGLLVSIFVIGAAVSALSVVASSV